MTEIVIGEHDREHRLADRHGADADARVVTALGRDLDLLAGWSTVRRGVRIDEVGFTAKRATIGWPVEMPPRMPPAWLDRNIGWPSAPIRISSAFSSPVKARGGEALADLDALDRIDRHHRRGDVLVELAVDRRAEPGRNALGDDLDDRADRGAAPCAMPSR